MKMMKKLLTVIVSVLMFLSSFVSAKAEGDDETFELEFEAKYLQNEARTMLAQINELRTGSDAWYWNEDNSEKVVLSNLGELNYDYGLERIAMLRCREIVASFSHTRPNGTRCFTAYDSGYRKSVGENIAYGYGTAQSAFVGCAEENEQYDGQGHRRNMLGANFTAVGIACVQYNGRKYWVQEFSDATLDTNQVSYSEEVQTMSVTALKSIASLTAQFTDTGYSQSGTAEVEEGKSLAMPEATGTIKLNNKGAFNVNVNVTAVSQDESIVRIDNNGITGVKPGTAKVVFTCDYNGVSAELSLDITVTAHTHEYSLKEWVWNDDLTEAYAVFSCGICNDEQKVQAEITETGNEVTAAVTFEGTVYTDTKSTGGPGPGPGITQISLTPTELSLSVGEAKTLTAFAVNVSDIKWTSSDPSVAEVNDSGLVTAIKTGTTVIRAASADDASVYDECKVTVGESWITLNSAALELQGYIVMNYKLDIPEEFSDAAVIMTVENEETKVNVADVQPDADNVRIFNCKAVSTQMRDDMTIRVVMNNVNIPMKTKTGTVCTNGYTYSIKKAIDAYKEFGNAKITALVTALDNFGQYAQIAFNHNANGLTPDSVDDVTADMLEAYKSEIGTNLDGLTLSKASVEVESATSIWLKYKLDEGKDIRNYTFKVDGEDASVESDGEFYVLKINNIKANKLGYKYTVTVTDGTNTQTVKYSALSYAYSVVNGGASAALVNLCKAMYKYYKAAVGVFGA